MHCSIGKILLEREWLSPIGAPHHYHNVAIMVIFFITIIVITIIIIIVIIFLQFSSTSPYILKCGIVLYCVHHSCFIVMFPPNSNFEESQSSSKCQIELPQVWRGKTGSNMASSCDPCRECHYIPNTKSSILSQIHEVEFDCAKLSGLRFPWMLSTFALTWISPWMLGRMLQVS